MKKMAIIFMLFSACTALQAVEDPIYQVHNKSIDQNYVVRDFSVYNYSDSYMQAFMRLQYNGASWRQFVRVDLVFFKQGIMAGTDYAYADYETYGNSGMWPGTETLVDFFVDTVEFDCVAFMVTYNSTTGREPRFNRNAIVVTNTMIVPYYETTFKIAGLVKNLSGTPLKYPKVFICIYKSGRMLFYDYTFADVSDNTLAPFQSATFDTYVDLPAAYDSLKFLPNYSLPLTGDIVITEIAEAEEPSLPSGFSLTQNFPNPFNSSTLIEFQLEKDEFVRLAVFNVTGRLVKVAAEGAYPAGMHRVIIQADDLPTGVYLYSLTAGSRRLVRRMTRMN